MEDILLLEVIERYLKGELNNDERAHFENLRKQSPEVDQLVVEHNLFLQEMETYGENRNFKHQLHETHNKLVAEGEINENVPVEKTGKVIQLWRKHKRVVGIAATIAGFTAVIISALVIYFTPSPNKEILYLSRKVDQVMQNVRVQGNQLKAVLDSSKVPVNETAANAGTSFLIDGKGYLITNAHVVAGASTIVVQNNKGQEFRAELAHLDQAKDLAILKIVDKDYKATTTLPYGIRKAAADLGEQVYTLGFPRDEIVYNEGYMSAKTGFNGDTSSCQIAVSANPGNSGGPVLNRNGEVIGVLSTAQSKAQGVVFAIKSKDVFQEIEELKKEDTSAVKIKAPTVSSIRGMDRVQQIKQIQDCVFMVKSFTK